jgi:hypothetical protein
VDIGEPLRELGAFDVGALVEAVLAQDEQAWLETPTRERSYEVHEQTRSIVLIFTDGSGWPNIEVTKEAGWDRLAKVALPLMHQVIERCYQPGGAIVRAMAAKLLAGGIIRPHRDAHPSFAHGHRIHIPIVTNSRVRFMIDGRPHRFEVGQVYEINNQKTHSVMNKGAEDRINFIFDYVPAKVIGARSA